MNIVPHSVRWFWLQQKHPPLPPQREWTNFTASNLFIGNIFMYVYIYIINFSYKLISYCEQKGRNMEKTHENLFFFNVSYYYYCWCKCALLAIRCSFSPHLSSSHLHRSKPKKERKKEKKQNKSHSITVTHFVSPQLTQHGWLRVCRCATDHLNTHMHARIEQ